MKVRSIKTNYFLNMLRVGLGTLVGLFTMPYVNRVLGAESLGKVEYIYSVISYFVLFSALGIPMYGIREIAKIRDNEAERTKLVVELLAILGLTTVISYIFIFGIVINLSHFRESQNLIILMSTIILFGNLGVEWFYQGMENQLYITIRYIIIRLFTLILLFVLVKSSEDYIYYGFIVVLTIVGGNLFNILYLRKHINLTLVNFKQLQIKRHIKPILTIFVATVSVSIYLQLDNIMLGSIAGEKAVGYYAVANKLIRFVILFITTLGAVMLPRLSNLITTDKSLYLQYAQKSINYILIIAIPFTLLFILMAEDFTLLMAGEEFLPSVLTMQILSPVIIIVGIAYFIGFLILYPQGKEKIYTIATIFSAGLSIVLNIFIIPRYLNNGTAVVAVLSELTGIIVMGYLGRKQLSEIDFFGKSIRSYIIASCFMAGGVFFFTVILPDLPLFVSVVVKMGVALSLFFGFLLLIKEQIAVEILHMLKNTVNTR